LNIFLTQKVELNDFYLYFEKTDLKQEKFFVLVVHFEDLMFSLRFVSCTLACKKGSFT